MRRVTSPTIQLGPRSAARIRRAAVGMRLATVWLVASLSTKRSPRSRPRLLESRPHLRRHSYRQAPDARQTKPKGSATLWTRVRRLIWSWWPWALVALYLIDRRQWWGAFGVALWAGVCSLSTPAEFPPQYGLDHDLE